LWGRYCADRRYCRRRAGGESPKIKRRAPIESVADGLRESLTARRFRKKIPANSLLPAIKVAKRECRLFHDHEKSAKLPERAIVKTVFRTQGGRVK